MISLLILFSTVSLVFGCGKMIGAKIHYSFDNVNDPLVEEISGTKHAIVTHGQADNIQYVGHDQGKALRVDPNGMTQVAAPHESALEPTQNEPISYMFWFKADSARPTAFMFLKNFEYGARLSATGMIDLYHGEQQTMYSKIFYVVQPDTWYHLAVTDPGVGNGDLNVYIDGIQYLATPSISGIRTDKNLPFQFGTWSEGAQYFKGSLDEIIVTDAIVNQASIQICVNMV